MQKYSQKLETPLKYHEKTKYPRNNPNARQSPTRFATKRKAATNDKLKKKKKYLGNTPKIAQSLIRLATEEERAKQERLLRGFNLCVCVCVCVCVCTYIYIYIYVHTYICRKRKFGRWLQSEDHLKESLVSLRTI